MTDDAAEHPAEQRAGDDERHEQATDATTCDRRARCQTSQQQDRGQDADAAFRIQRPRHHAITGREHE